MVWSKIVWDVTRRVGDNMDGLGPTLTGPYPRRRETGGSGRTNPPIKGAPRRVEDVSLSGGADLVRALPNSSVVADCVNGDTGIDAWLQGHTATAAIQRGEG